MSIMRVTVNRGLDGKFRKLGRMLEGYTEVYAQKVSEQIVLRSPVDTGTYMEGHNLGVSAVGPSQSSRNKPRNQPYQPYADAALSKLYAQASALPPEASLIVFSNDAYHADMVEFEHGYAPYRSAMREHKRLASEAEAEVKARFR